MQGLQHRWTGEPEELGEVWTLRKGQKRARCAVSTHPLGWELRLTVRSELLRSQLHRDQMALLDEADAWKAAMREKQWT